MTTCASRLARPTIAVGIVSRSEATDLDACLSTVTWPAEIIVLNMGPTDDTLDQRRLHGHGAWDSRLPGG